MCTEVTKKKNRRTCRSSKVRHYNKKDMSRAYLTRKQYLLMLSRPNYRRILDLQEKLCNKNLPNLRSCGPMFPTSLAAMKSRARKRIRILSKPRVTKSELLKKKFLHDQMRLTKDERKEEQMILPEHYVKLPALYAKATKRIKRLSYPKMMYIASQVKEYGPLLGKEFAKRLIEYMKKHPKYIDEEKKKDKKYETFHIKSHKSTQAIIVCKVPKKKHKPMSKEEYEEWLKKIAAAKPLHKPPPPRKKKRVRLAELKARLDVISKPARVYERIDPEQFFRVKRSALKYQATDRINQIALPRFKEEEEEFEFTSSGVSPKALKAVATPAILKLSKPVERKSRVEEEYEYAFKVKPEALKARCTKRTKELARPVER